MTSLPPFFSSPHLVFVVKHFNELPEMEPLLSFISPHVHPPEQNGVAVNSSFAYLL